MSEIRTIYDNTFVLGQTSATNFVGGPGISITQPSEGTIRISNDETVLYTGDGTNLTLSEDAYNFERLRFYLVPGQGNKWVEATLDGGSKLSIGTQNGEANAWWRMYLLSYDSSTYKFTVNRTKSIGTSFTNTSVTLTGALDNAKEDIKAIYGINRISGGNA